MPFFLLYFLCLIPLHAFHVSKALVEYNPGDQAIQVSLHLFLDDLEEALRRQGADHLFLCTDKEKSGAETHLSAYLNQHFRIEVDGQPQKWNFLGKEPSEDLAGVWCYLEIQKAKPSKSIKITCSLLTEVFDDQKNIVHLVVPGKREGSFLLSKARQEETISF